MKWEMLDCTFFCEVDIATEGVFKPQEEPKVKTALLKMALFKITFELYRSYKNTYHSDTHTRTSLQQACS